MFKSYKHGLDILGMGGLATVGHGGGHHGGHHGGGGRGFRGGWGGWGGYYPYDIDEPYYVIDVSEPDEYLPVEQAAPAPVSESASALAAVARAQDILNRAGLDLEGVKKAAPAKAAVKTDVVIGGYDIAAWRKQMNELKQVSILMAQVLVARGQEAIDGAIKASKQPWYKKDLPGETARNTVKGKLQWHADNLAKMAPSAWSTYQQFQTDPDAFKKAGAQLQAFYPSGADLEKWVMQAFVEANAAEEGAAYLAAAWSAMWREIGAAIAALPAEAAKAVKGMAAGLKWGLIIGGSVLGVAAGGALIYKAVKKT